MNKFHLRYCSIIAVLVALLTLSLTKCKRVEEVEKRVTDTVTIVRIDTIVRYSPTYIYKKTTDTLYLPTNDKSFLTLPWEQTYYHKDNEYDLWISGYKTNVDSIKTYASVESKTITNNVTKEIYKSTLDLYPYLGFRHFDGKVGQVVGLSLKMPKKWMYSGEIGVIDSKIYYGVSLGFQIK